MFGVTVGPYDIAFEDIGRIIMFGVVVPILPVEIAGVETIVLLLAAETIGATTDAVATATVVTLIEGVGLCGDAVEAAWVVIEMLGVATETLATDEADGEMMVALLIAISVGATTEAVDVA